MKLILSLMLVSVLHLPADWNTDFEKAKAEAIQSHKLIVLNFSGSDWCGPCIRMKKEIFESHAFEEYAAQNLVPMVSMLFQKSILPAITTCHNSTAIFWAPGSGLRRQMVYLG